jgi:hypothetical protein
VAHDLLLVPGDEDGVDGHQADPAPHRAGGEQRRLAEADHGDVQRSAALQQAGLLEVADDEGGAARALGRDGVADRLRRAAELGDRVEVPVGRREAVHLEPDARAGRGVERRLQAADIGRLLRRVDEALVPDARRRRLGLRRPAVPGRGRVVHALPPRANRAPRVAPRGWGAHRHGRASRAPGGGGRL